VSRKRTFQRITVPVTLALAAVLTALAAVTASGSPGATRAVARPGAVPPIILAAHAAPRAAAVQPPRHPPRQIARAMLVHRFGWKAWQFKYLNRLWATESGWNRYATNPYSGAYGIPQAVPGSKMSSAGPGWQWNARTQIRWGMRYIQARYRTPYWAWRHLHGDGWY
jgi:hypothetical protein